MILENPLPLINVRPNWIILTNGKHPYPSDQLRKKSALQTKVELAQNLAENLAHREIASWKKKNCSQILFEIQYKVYSLFNIKIYLPANN